jgi:integrase
MPFTFPSTKKYCLAATKERIVEVSKEAVEIIPAVLAKYLRPNKPSTT